MPKKSSKNKNSFFFSLISKRYRIPAILALAFAAIGVLALVQSGAESNFSATGGRPFASNSAWNTLIPANPKLDPNNAAMVTRLSSGANPGIANLYDFGKPVYFADSQTPRHSVDCTQSWGVCQLEKEPIPIPAGAKPAGGSDGHMVVVDLNARKSYEFWQYKVVNGKHQTSWGGVSNIDGEGRDGGAIGAGVSVLAGLIRISDIQKGSIDHALAFSTNACAGPSNSNNFRYPASKTDGRDTSISAIPEGARVQLDPSVNVDAIPGITAGEKMIAKALQKYGAYAVDCGGATMGYYFEDPKSQGKADPYPALGFQWDYYGMNKIPWDKLRVLDASVTQPGGSSSTPIPAPAPPVNPEPAPQPTPIPSPTPIPQPVSDKEKPTPASSLTASGVTGYSVDLKWNPARDNIGVTKYNIWRVTTGAQWVQIGQVDGGTVTFKDPSLSVGTTYSYGIRAVDAAGNVSDSSNIISVTTPKPSGSVSVGDNQAPSAPTHLTATRVNDSSVVLSWGASTDNREIKNYNIWRTDANSSQWKLVGKTDARTTVYTDDGISSGKSYSYGVRAVDGAGNISDSSNILLVVTPKKPWYYLWWR